MVVMVTSTPVSLSQPCVPIYIGKDYRQWPLRTKTVFHSQELWELVEKGVDESGDEAMQRENKKRDEKA